MHSLKHQLQALERLAESGRGMEALHSLDSLEKEHPEDASINASKAYVNALEGTYESALLEWTKAIAKCDKEPHFFCMRGEIFTRLGRYQEAVNDFTKVLDLCDLYASDYYKTPAYFRRADAFVRSGRYAEARRDCAFVPDGEVVWLDKRRTKEEILAECDQGTTSNRRLR